MSFRGTAWTGRVQVTEAERQAWREEDRKQDDLRRSIEILQVMAEEIARGRGLRKHGRKWVVGGNGE